MAVIYKCNGKTIQYNRQFVDADGTTHPGSWYTYSEDQRAALGITELIEDIPPDSRLFLWSMDSDGKITSTPKDINDSTETIDGEVVTFPGVTSLMITEIKERQADMLGSTDWAYVRQMDTNTDVPANIQQWRNEIRLAATAKENQISQAADIDAIAAVINADGWNDWPELG
tara:strand:- start:108 stop:623 length:516 start_codon:yes stop_codon:yes gene_type:complete